jgi:hypothetical protein
LRIFGSLLVALSLLFGVGGVASRSVAESGAGSSAMCTTPAEPRPAEINASLEGVTRRLSAASASDSRVIPLNTRGYNYEAAGDTMPAPPRPSEPAAPDQSR